MDRKQAVDELEALMRAEAHYARNLRAEDEAAAQSIWREANDRLDDEDYGQPPQPLPYDIIIEGGPHFTTLTAYDAETGKQITNCVYSLTLFAGAGRSVDAMVVSEDDDGRTRTSYCTVQFGRGE